jgi:hypothetical protein
MHLRLALNLLHFLTDLGALYALCYSSNFYEIQPKLTKLIGKLRFLLNLTPNGHCLEDPMVFILAVWKINTQLHWKQSQCYMPFNYEIYMRRTTLPKMGKNWVVALISHSSPPTCPLNFKLTFKGLQWMS